MILTRVAGLLLGMRRCEAFVVLAPGCGRVRSRMNRARTSLRRSLGPAGEPGPDGAHREWSAVTRVKES